MLTTLARMMVVTGMLCWSPVDAAWASEASDAEQSGEPAPALGEPLGRPALAIVAAVLTQGAVVVPALLVGAVVLVGWNALSATLVMQSVVAGLAVGLLGPVAFLAIVAPAILLAPLLGTFLGRLAGNWRMPLLPSSGTAWLVSLIGLGVGVVLHEIGFLALLATAMVIWMFVVIIEALVGAICSAACGGSSREQEVTSLFSFRPEPEDAPGIYAAMLAWSVTAIVPASIGAAVGCGLGNALGMWRGRGRFSNESALSVDLLDVPPVEPEAEAEE